MSTEATLTLKGQSYALRWDLAALYRLQESGREGALEQVGGKKALKAALDLLWAMLPEAARAQLSADTPAALATEVSAAGLGMEELVETLHAALEGSVLTGAKKAAPSS